MKIIWENSIIPQLDARLDFLKIEHIKIIYKKYNLDLPLFKDKFMQT